MMKRRNLAELIFFIAVLLIFIINSSYVSYPDEFVNLLGGKFILQGKVPYREFFDHHLPFAWYFASILLPFTFGSFIAFRHIYAIFMFAVLGLLGIWIKRQSKNLYPYYLIFFILYPLVAVYFWLHLYIADSLASLFFSLIFWILLIQTIEKKVVFKTIVISSILNFILLFSSMSYLYVVLILYMWQFYLLLISKPTIKRIFTYALLALSPYVVYFFYLLMTDSLTDFFFANFTYNTKLYIDIPNYTLGRIFNPMKFGFTLIYNFWNGYLPKLVTIKDFNIYFPVGILTIVSSFILLLILLKNYFFIGILFFFVLSFSAPRSNFKEFNETDYQMGLFIVLGIISSAVVLYLLQNEKLRNQLIDDLRRLSQLLITIFLIFASLFLLKNTYDKWYLRYTQKMPHIYDLAYTGDFVNQLLNKNDYFWIGPYEPHEIFFVKEAKLPGKFVSLLPQFKQDEILKESFIKDLEVHPPKIIVFKKHTGVFNTPADKFGDFFLEWMKNKYTALEDITGLAILKSPSSFTLNSDLYLLNSEKEQLLIKLKNQGYIR